MPERIKKWLVVSRRYLERLSLQKKILLGVMSVLVSGSILSGIIMSQRNPYKVLFTDLQADEVRSVVKKLSDMKIPHSISEDGTSLSVPSSMVDSVRMELAKEGFPGQDVVGFEKFDKSTLGMSSYVQRIQYVRAVQGELTRSIERLKSVRRARVHISIPPKKTFLEDEDPPKASVVLELKNGLQPTKTEITGIAHLVASAVEGLQVSEVSIVDTRGNFLHAPGGDSLAERPSKLMELQRSMEKEYERRIEEILMPVVGVGKVRARVAVEVDPARVNMTEESFDPERSALRANIKNEETMNGSRPNPIGIPGSRSNLPGSEAQNPPLPMANTSSSKIAQNADYAIPRKITVTDKPSGGIKRLSVAVVVDGHYPKAEGVGQKPAFVPRTDEELQRLKSLVENTVGLDESRRDSITITSMPFADSLMGAEEERGPWGSRKELMQNLIKNGLIGLLILSFFFIVLRPFLKWSSAMDTTPVLRSLPKTVAEIEAEVGKKGLLALTESTVPQPLDDISLIDKKEEQQLKEKILQKIEGTPNKAVLVVQDWIDEGASTKTMAG